MRAIDTNVLIRSLTRDDAEQTKAADQFVMHGAWISHIVLAETIWVLKSLYQRTPRQLADAIEMLLSHEHFVLDEPDVVKAALDVYTANPSLGFSDCLVLEIARKAGHSPLGTFDHNLSKKTDAHLIEASGK